ncbi:MAG: hypothetical protein ACRD8A_11060 [Candidatus Acidiferrales bacterium]
MNTPAVAAPASSSRTFSQALWIVVRIGLIAGTLDIGENIIFNAFRGITPTMIFRFIASGLIGTKSALALGAASVALGVAIHYFIATGWTAVYYVASRKMKFLVRNAAISGIVYGGLVYFAMNFVVLPLTRIPHPKAAVSVASRVRGVLALLFCIGLTVALLVRRSDRLA